MKCDTCGRDSDRVARVVIDEGYNRLAAKPLWNCPECFEQKELKRRVAAVPRASLAPPSDAGEQPSR